MRSKAWVVSLRDIFIISVDKCFVQKVPQKKTDTCRTTNSLLKVKENEEKEEKAETRKESSF